MKRRVFCLALLFFISMSCFAQQSSCCSSSCSKVIERSVVSKGNITRLQHVFAKAARKEPIVVGVIGGSITEGAAASKTENRYSNRVYKWWQEKFPQTDIKFVNAGIGATCSDMGSHRVKDHLLSHKPDFIVIEFAVNDRAHKMVPETMEGLIRQTLSAEKKPAVMLLFMMDSQGGSTQAQHAAIGKHYDLPMISFKDALWPEVQAGRIKWDDIEKDAVHPSDKGHEYVAKFITSYLESVLKKTDVDGKLPAVNTKLPKPKKTDLFENTQWLTPLTTTASKSSGWSSDVKGCIYSGFFGNGWFSDRPGSILEFEVKGTAFGVVYHYVKGDTGIIEISVDDGEPVKIDGYFAADWGGGFAEWQLAVKNLKPGLHTVRVKLLEEKNKKSTGNGFRFMALTAAGQ